MRRFIRLEQKTNLRFESNLNQQMKTQKRQRRQRCNLYSRPERTVNRYSANLPAETVATVMLIAGNRGDIVRPDTFLSLDDEEIRATEIYSRGTHFDNCLRVNIILHD